MTTGGYKIANPLAADVPGFEQTRMTCPGPTVGVRETRKLQGIHQVSGAELARTTKFDDGIVCGDNPINIVMGGATEMTHAAMVKHGAYYAIPFRAGAEKDRKPDLHRADPVSRFHRIRLDVRRAAMHGHGPGHRHRGGDCPGKRPDRSTDQAEKPHRGIAGQGVKGLGDDPLV